VVEKQFVDQEVGHLQLIPIGKYGRRYGLALFREAGGDRHIFQ
jgi:hypothetical protein